VGFTSKTVRMNLTAEAYSNLEERSAIRGINCSFSFRCGLVNVDLPYAVSKRPPHPMEFGRMWRTQENDGVLCKPKCLI
jgi:hypothetical protein